MCHGPNIVSVLLCHFVVLAFPNSWCLVLSHKVLVFTFWCKLFLSVLSWFPLMVCVLVCFGGFVSTCHLGHVL